MKGETKLGLLTIVILLVVFSYVVYEKWGEQIAKNGTTENADGTELVENGSDDSSNGEDSPFKDANADQSKQPIQLAANNNSEDLSSENLFGEPPAEENGVVAEATNEESPFNAEEPAFEENFAQQNEAFSQDQTFADNDSFADNSVGNDAFADANTAFEENNNLEPVEEDAFGQNDLEVNTFQVEEEPFAEPTEQQPLEEPFADAGDAFADNTPVNTEVQQDVFQQDDAFTDADVNWDEEESVEVSSNSNFAQNGLEASQNFEATEEDLFSGEVASNEMVAPENDVFEEQAEFSDQSAPAENAPFDLAEEQEPTFGQSQQFSEPVAGNNQDVFAESDNLTEEPAPFDLADTSVQPEAQATPLDSDPFGEQPATGWQGNTYQVQKGDSLWTIAKKLYGSPKYFDALVAFNKKQLPNPNALKPGMVLSTPEISRMDQYLALMPARSSQANTTVVQTSPKPDPFAEEQGGFFVSEGNEPRYRVQKNDTLSQISQNHLGRSSRWVQIYALNKDSIQDPNNLQVGTVLSLPLDASRVRLVSNAFGAE